MKNKKGEIGLDITRIVAFMMVTSIHFFLHSGYYDIPMLGKKMYIMTFVRTISGVCVPLFMLLSGYLMCQKKLGLKKELFLSFMLKY